MPTYNEETDLSLNKIEMVIINLKNMKNIEKKKSTKKSIKKRKQRRRYIFRWNINIQNFSRASCNFVFRKHKKTDANKR